MEPLYGWNDEIGMYNDLLQCSKAYEKAYGIIRQTTINSIQRSYHGDSFPQEITSLFEAAGDVLEKAIYAFEQYILQIKFDLEFDPMGESPYPKPKYLVNLYLNDSALSKSKEGK